MLTQKPQAITGVSPNHEVVIEELYPSISATRVGVLIQQILECIPQRFWGMKISHLIFGLPVAPIAAATYLWSKVFGCRYVLTNRSLKRLNSLGFGLQEEVPLPQIDSITIDPDSRTPFYRTGDLRLVSKDGQTRMIIRGVPNPDRFSQVISETCDAQRLVRSSLAQIQARHAH